MSKRTQQKPSSTRTIPAVSYRVHAASLRGGAREKHRWRRGTQGPADTELVALLGQIVRVELRMALEDRSLVGAPPPPLRPPPARASLGGASQPRTTRAAYEGFLYLPIVIWPRTGTLITLVPSATVKPTEAQVPSLRPANLIA